MGSKTIKTFDVNCLQKLLVGGPHIFHCPGPHKSKSAPGYCHIWPNSIISHPSLAWIIVQMISGEKGNIQSKFSWTLFDRLRVSTRNWFLDMWLITKLSPNSVYPKHFLPNPKYSNNFWLQCSRVAPLFPPMVEPEMSLRDKFPGTFSAFNSWPGTNVSTPNSLP